MQARTCMTCKHERRSHRRGGHCHRSYRRAVRWAASAAAMRKTALTVAVSGERRFVVGLRAENESTPGDTQRADAYKMRL